MVFKLGLFRITYYLCFAFIYGIVKVKSVIYMDNFIIYYICVFTVITNN